MTVRLINTIKPNEKGPEVMAIKGYKRVRVRGVRGSKKCRRSDRERGKIG